MKHVAVIVSLMFFVACTAWASDGEKLFTRSCVGCHGADGSKSAGGTTPLKEMPAAEILTKLKGYAAGTIGGKNKAVMTNIAEKYSEEELEALAAYTGKL